MSEINGNGRKLNLPGLYRHKETGVTVELEATPGIGTPLIDAYIQAGFVRVEDEPEVKVEVVPEPKKK